MAIRDYLIIAASIGVLGSSAFAQEALLIDCKTAENSKKEECFCQDSNKANRTEEEEGICVAWLASGGIPVGGVATAGVGAAGATAFAPLIAPVAGVLGLGLIAGGGGSSTSTGTTTTGTN